MGVSRTPTLNRLCSLRLGSLERFVRQSRKHIRILGHPQHDIGIETAQPQAPRLLIIAKVLAL